MHEELGGYGDPGSPRGGENPQCDGPGVCVFTSVFKCVLQRAHSVGARACERATPCAKETPCMDEAPRVPETPCVEATMCVSGVVTSVPECDRCRDLATVAGGHYARIR